MSRTLVIAEAGSNHDCSLERALALVYVAKDCGADVVKYQFWSSAARMVRRRNAPDYLQVYEKYRMPEEWLQPILAECQALDIEFMCSTYLPEDVAVIAPMVKMLKIASFEANDPEHLVAHVKPRRSGKRVIVSLGMGADPSVVREWLREREGEAGGIMFLHCVSAYPTPTDQMNLGVLRPMWNRINFAGLSDHAPGDHTWTGALAVAAGAIVVERHFRLSDGDTTNPDHEHAMTPRDFKHYVQNIRYAEAACGHDPSHDAQPAETPMRAYRVLSDMGPVR